MCGVRNCAKCAGSSAAEGCAACNDGSYAFFDYDPSAKFASTALVKTCFSCQELNCAAGGCSDNVGVSRK